MEINNDASAADDNACVESAQSPLKKTPEQCQREHDDFLIAMDAYRVAEAQSEIEMAELDKEIRAKFPKLFSDEKESG